jgi:hypothetical protein
MGWNVAVVVGVPCDKLVAERGGALRVTVGCAVVHHGAEVRGISWALGVAGGGCSGLESGDVCCFIVGGGGGVRGGAEGWWREGVVDGAEMAVNGYPSDGGVLDGGDAVR